MKKKLVLKKEIKERIQEDIIQVLGIIAMIGIVNLLFIIGG